MKELDNFRKFLTEGEDVNEKLDSFGNFEFGHYKSLGMKFQKEGLGKLFSQGVYWVKNNDLGPKTTTEDIQKWIDDNFKKYVKPMKRMGAGEKKRELLKVLAKYNDDLKQGKGMRENLSEITDSSSPVKTFTNNLKEYTSYVHCWAVKLGTMSMDKENGKFVYNYSYELIEDATYDEIIDMVSDVYLDNPEVVSLGIDIYYTTGQTQGKTAGHAEVVRWTHDAWFKSAQSDYIQNAERDKNEDIEAERIIAIRRWMNSSNMGRRPENVVDKSEVLYPMFDRMKKEIKQILSKKAGEVRESTIVTEIKRYLGDL